MQGYKDARIQRRSVILSGAKNLVSKAKSMKG